MVCLLMLAPLNPQPNMMDLQKHKTTTIDQFSKQAIPFAKLSGHSSAMQVLADLASPQPDTEMLDVACGPGLVARHFAPLVRQVTGIDLTPEMIRQANKLKAEQGIENATFIEGSALPLPFEDARFSLVLTRYSFHHFQNPAAAMHEMIRVCRPGGRVLVADVSLPAANVEAYDAMELLRDPSHVHALSHDEFSAVFQNPSLCDIQFGEYEVAMALEEQLAASFPVDGGANRIREMVSGDVGVDRYGISARFIDEALWYSIPIAVGVATVVK